jgi:hypothetical protein
MDNGCFNYSAYNQIVWPFDWADVPGAYQYNVVVYKLGSTGHYINTNVWSTSQYTFTTSGTYIPEVDRYNWRWKVRVSSGSCWSAWSEERSFTVEAPNTDCQ